MSIMGFAESPYVYVCTLVFFLQKKKASSAGGFAAIGRTAWLVMHSQRLKSPEGSRVIGRPASSHVWYLHEYYRSHCL